MASFREILGLSRSKEYEDAVARRQESGRQLTGGTGYSDRQTRGLQFASDVARGWTAQALGDSMTGNQGSNTAAINAAITAQNATNQNNQYENLKGLDEARLRSEGLQVSEANEQEKAKSDNFYNTLQTGVNTANTLLQGGIAATRGGNVNTDRAATQATSK